MGVKKFKTLIDAKKFAGKLTPGYDIGIFESGIEGASDYTCCVVWVQNQEVEDFY